MYECMCVCVCVWVAQLGLNLCDPMDYCQAPPPMGFSRREQESGLPFPSPIALSKKSREPWANWGMSEGEDQIQWFDWPEMVFRAHHRFAELDSKSLSHNLTFERNEVTGIPEDKIWAITISQSRITNTQWKSLHEWESETTNFKEIILKYTSYSNKTKVKTMLKEIKKELKLMSKQQGFLKWP